MGVPILNKGAFPLFIALAWVSKVIAWFSLLSQPGLPLILIAFLPSKEVQLHQ